MLAKVPEENKYVKYESERGDYKIEKEEELIYLGVALTKLTNQKKLKNLKMKRKIRMADNSIKSKKMYRKHRYKKQL